MNRNGLVDKRIAEPVVRIPRGERELDFIDRGDAGVGQRSFREADFRIGPFPRRDGFAEIGLDHISVDRRIVDGEVQGCGLGFVFKITLQNEAEIIVGIDLCDFEDADVVVEDHFVGEGINRRGRFVFRRGAFDSGLRGIRLIGSGFPRGGRSAGGEREQQNRGKE